MPQGVKIQWTDDFENEFIEMVIRCRGSVRAAVKAMHISHGPLYQHAADKPDFMERIEQARRIGARVLEDVVFADCLDGIKEPVFSGGKQVLDAHGNPVFIRRIPWGARLSMLSAAFPEKYGKHRFEMSGPGGGPISVTGRVHIYIPDNGRLPQEDAVQISKQALRTANPETETKREALETSE